jgi:hypothetical protein
MSIAEDPPPTLSPDRLAAICALAAADEWRGSIPHPDLIWRLDLLIVRLRLHGDIDSATPASLASALTAAPHLAADLASHDDRAIGFALRKNRFAAGL